MLSETIWKQRAEGRWLTNSLTSIMFEAISKETVRSAQDPVDGMCVSCPTVMCEALTCTCLHTRPACNQLPLSQTSACRACSARSSNTSAMPLAQHQTRWQRCGNPHERHVADALVRLGARAARHPPGLHHHSASRLVDPDPPLHLSTPTPVPQHPSHSCKRDHRLGLPSALAAGCRTGGAGIDIPRSRWASRRPAAATHCQKWMAAATAATTHYRMARKKNIDIPTDRSLGSCSSSWRRWSRTQPTTPKRLSPI
eukprot:1391134-Rhodomonas_salina.3